MNFSFIIYYYKKILFFNLLIICGCAGFCCCAGFSLVAQLQQPGATLHCSAQASRCCGFSCGRVQTLGCTGFSSCGLWALERRLNSCGAQVQLLRGMWDLPKSGIKLVSPALTGGLFTTEPPGKPKRLLYSSCNHKRSPDFQGSLLGCSKN